MKKIKTSIAIISIIIIIILITLGILNSNQRNKESKMLQQGVDNKIVNETTHIEMETGEEGQKTANTVSTEIDTLDYMNIEKCISSFLSIANRNNTAYFGSNGNKTTSDEEISSLILDLLSEKYINKNGINKNNVNQYIYNINENTFYVPIKVNKFYGDSQVNSFVVEGLIENQSYKNITESKMILNLDITNNTFSVEILNNQQDINKIKPDKINSIEKRDINTYDNAKNTEQEIIKEILKQYKRTILGYPEIFYNNYLNKEYSNKKFANLNEFKSYIEKNRSLIQQINVEKYKLISNNKNKAYSLIDQYGNIFIIEYNSIIDYKIYLDNYTVELDTFKENYEKSEDNTKIAIQIGKFKQMLNSKDYNAIYGKLNTTFKNNNYSTVAKLESYLAKNIYDINTIIIEDYSKNEDYYICKCILQNQKNTKEQKNMTIVIKLIDSNNFEMSFSIS